MDVLNLCGDRTVLVVIRRQILFVDLFVQCPQIIQPAHQEQPAGAEPDYSGYPFAQVHPVNPKVSKECQKKPCDVVVMLPAAVTAFGGSVQSGHQEQIDQPTNPEQSEREEPQGTGQLFAVVEAMRPGKPEKPAKIANQQAVAGLIRIAQRSVSRRLRM